MRGCVCQASTAVGSSRPTPTDFSKCRCHLIRSPVPPTLQFTAICKPLLRVCLVTLADSVHLTPSLDGAKHSVLFLTVEKLPY